MAKSPNYTVGARRISKMSYVSYKKKYISSSVGRYFILIGYGQDETVLFAEYSFLVRFILQTVTGWNSFDWHNLSNLSNWSASFRS